MLDGNSAAERKYSAKVAKRGDAPEFSYHDTWDEADMIVREMLTENAFEALELLSDESENNNFKALADYAGLVIKSDSMMMLKLTLLAKKKYADKIQERLEKEQQPCKQQ